MKFTVGNLSRLHEWDRKKIEFALQGLNRIILLPQFREELMKAKLTETKIDGAGAALDNLQVYQWIMSADQLHPLDKLSEFDIDVVLYRKSFSKVVGYTFTNSLTVWMNRKFFGSPMGIASNLFHEATHQLGFLHNGSWSTAVPYVINRITEKLWDEHCIDIDLAYEKWWYS